MRLGNLNKAIQLARGYDMDSIDISILCEIAKMRNHKGVATIMQFMEREAELGPKSFASFKTIHTRVGRMVESGILTREVDPKNKRVKVLQDGPMLGTFLDRLHEL